MPSCSRCSRHATIMFPEIDKEGEISFIFLCSYCYTLGPLKDDLARIAEKVR